MPCSSVFVHAKLVCETFCLRVTIILIPHSFTDGSYRLLPEDVPTLMQRAQSRSSPRKHQPVGAGTNTLISMCEKERARPSHDPLRTFDTVLSCLQMSPTPPPPSVSSLNTLL
eukprot:5004454-Pleurochrysis_carterae.AAC.3